MKIQAPALPKSDCLMVAAATPLTADLHPDVGMLARHIAMLLDAGCDGVALFGTTGEGTEFSVEDRTEALEASSPPGVAPQQAHRISRRACPFRTSCGSRTMRSTARSTASC